LFCLVPAFFEILSNIEQTPTASILYDRPAGMNMEQQKQWRFEVNNPQRSTEWQPLFEVDEDQLAASRELKDEINKINAPIRLRIVCCAT